MKKILFIIQSYPSQRSANVLCDEKIIKSLDLHKYDVHVLSSCYHNQNSEETINGIHVHRINRGIFWRIFTWSKDNSVTRRGKFVLNTDRIIMRIKQVLTIFQYPNYQPLLTRKIAKEALQLQQKEHFDLVISEFNGYETLYAGAQLKKNNSSVKFMPIFWDSLSGGFNAKYLPSSYCIRKKTSQEKSILKLSDTAVIMESHQKHCLSLWGTTPYIKKITVLNVPYLVHNIATAKTNILDTNKINIVFAGSFGNRNPSYIINLFKKLNRTDIVIWFVCDNSFHNMLRKKIGNFTDCFKIHSYIPNAELINLLNQADIMLNIGVLNPNAISAKIFEYMSLGHPLISTYAIDNEACLLFLRQYPLSLLIDERELDINININKINAFLDTKSKCRMTYEDVEKLYPLSTPKAYAHLIDSLLEGDK